MYSYLFFPPPWYFFHLTTNFFSTPFFAAGVVVDGVEYVDSADEIPRSHIDDVVSFIENNLKGEDFLHDGSREYSEAEVNPYSQEDYNMALAFITTDSELRTQFLGGALKGLKNAAKQGLNQAKSSLQEAALKEIVKIGKKGFSKLPPRVQALIREIAGIAAGSGPAPKAKGKPKKKKKDDGKGMDPFAKKHYDKGFVPGNLGKLNLMAYKPPKAASEARLIEDCMGCRFIWKHVEMDIGNAYLQKTVYDSFMHHCRRGMTAPLLYGPCQTMFTSLDDMVNGYVAGLAVEEVCAQARMCR